MDSQGDTSRDGTPRVSPRVYHRRRIAVLILALLVVGALVWAGIVIAGLIGGDQNGEAAPAPTAAPSAAPATPTPAAAESTGPAETSEPTEEPSASPSPTEDACAEAQVEVAASTDAEAYEPERNPVLTLTVSNTGDEACPVNVGTSQMEFLVTSGENRVFSSADCQEGAEDLIREIPAGGSEEANFTWERIRSLPGCETVEATPAPGSYDLTVSLGDRTSDASTFELQ
ncbi:hypothetical protein IWX64_001752 [Arthrobacter sp. CAN_A212]|uniref:hypothetical protein n=1 Tax=unclassified Arthrobacter TaxID=235627 RepID=UPI0018CB0667|nr:hypothetical protein [Arthrobacter sp. CAN_C5]MBP2218431.1 hypothetical protein [Arthrobacter sp. CAN_C5]